MSMVNEGHEQGVLEANEAEMITKIFEFGDKEAGDIMTHRGFIKVNESDLPIKYDYPYKDSDFYLLKLS